MELSSISKISMEEGNNNNNNNNNDDDKTSGDFSHSSLGNIQPDHNTSSDVQISGIRLNLTITPEFCNFINISLANEKAQENRLLDNILSEPAPEKFRASNFSALSLTIGTWQKFSQREDDLVVKFYYKKKKIVWEILNGDLKNKIEFPFSNIDAIKATICDNEPGELKIELKEPPDIATEATPQPLRHTIWESKANDFTQNKAFICRRHVVTCQPGDLEKHYNLLLQFDGRLLELSQKPFPIDDYPMFSQVHAIFNKSSQCNSCGGSPVDPLVQRCYSCSNGFFESNVLQTQGFNQYDGNYVNAALNWNRNHLSNNQENIFLPQGQELISPSIVASSSEISLETDNFHPLIEQSWVTTSQDNFGVNHSTLVDDVFAYSG